MKLWRTRIGLMLVLFLFVLPGSFAGAEGDWFDGHSAMYVLGQSNFETANEGISASGLYDPKDAVVDERHLKLYVVDGGNNRVLRYSLPITENRPSAEMVFGQSSMQSATPSTSQGGLRNPRGIAVDSTGRLWIADAGNHRVLWFHDAYSLTEYGPPADGVLGQPNFVVGTAATSQAGMNSPMDIAAGDISTIYVADRGNNRILRFVDAASKMDGGDADAVLGQAGFSTSVAGTTPSLMDSPSGVAMEGDVLFVADTGNARVLRYDNVAAKTNGADADGVLGQPDFYVSEHLVSATGMSGPARVAVDSQGWLYVSDALPTSTASDRVLIFVDAVALADGAAADRVVGQRDFVSSDEVTPSQTGLDIASTGGGISLSAQYNYLVVTDDNNNRVLIFKPWAINLPLVIK